MRPNKAAAAAAAAALRGSNTRLTVRHDAIGRGYVAVAAAPPAVPDPELTGSKCENGDGDEDEPATPPSHTPPPKEDPATATAPQPQPTVLETDSEEPKQELCSTCEPEPEPKPEPTCNTCEQEPELTCNKVHAVQEGEMCYSVGQCAGLGQDDFLRFNPNICCDHLFVGQWVCLEATCAA